MRFFLLIFAFVLVVCEAQKEVSRHSFRPPYSTSVPFWNFGAGTYLNSTYVRVTPARQSRTGFIWNNVKQTTMTDWEAILEFSVSGLKNLGGDGFAFWYVEKPELIGSVYGSQDFWVGLGIFFDTFNNNARGDNPLITAQWNDGTQRYNPNDDGEASAIARCSFPFRNLPQSSFAKITYRGQALSVDIALHRDQSGQPAYVECFHVENIELGLDKYFGITAHTGDVADNHDMHSLVLNDLSPAEADVESARRRFREKIQIEHAQPTHQEMSQRDFQHEVLTLLNQMQEAQNLLEISQIAIENLISTSLGYRQDDTAASASSASSLIGNDVLTRIDELKSLIEASRHNNNNNDGQSVVNTVQNFLSNNLHPTVQNSLQGARTFSEQEFRKVQDQFRTLTSEQRQILNQLSSVQEVVNNQGSGIFIYLLLFAILTCLIIIMITLFKGSRDKYPKFI